MSAQQSKKASGQSAGRKTSKSAAKAAASERKLRGTPASRGIAFGRIRFLKRISSSPDRSSIRDPAAEIDRFEKARVHAISQLAALYEASLEKIGEQNAVVFQIHQMMLEDPDYVNSIHDLIAKEKVNAEYAVDQVARRFERNFRSMDNDYMQGRASDVVDISRRVNEILMMHSGAIKSKSVRYESSGEPVILATDDLAPSETVQLDPVHVTGILTSAGSTRSHTVIFARTMALPAVICLGDENLTADLEGHEAIIDGATGTVIIDPDKKTAAEYRERKRTDDTQRAHLEQFRGRETATRSGRRILLYANAGSLADLDLIKASDAEGIGLFRSEYIYLSSSDFPTEDYQFDIYRKVLREMKGRRVIIRTLDIGADKTADYFMLKPESNPAMGLRAVRLCLENVALFKTQLRALYRASVYGRLGIMIPMISSVEEVKRVKEICKEVQETLTAQGIPWSDKVEFGIMVETPAAALISDELAPLVDFFSIGTNDLTQFTLAADRQNAGLAPYLCATHHAVLRLIEMTVRNAHTAGIWVGVCGEAASDDNFTARLVQLGIDEISVVPANILRLRAAISTIG
ncbi:MAG: phosphoenolpyruvate--protein phosphotransferase [Succinivibrio sp.]|nr:phosphoenolpyruvate--protein phosphotransferase [Succinivibrio sp.]